MALSSPTVQVRTHRRRPVDTWSTDGRILTRGLFEIELADEYAGILDRFYDATNPTDRHVLTLNVYAVVPDHENGCGRELLPNGSAATNVPADTPDALVKELVGVLADRFGDLAERAGFAPAYISHEMPPDVGHIISQLAYVTPEWIGS